MDYLASPYTHEDPRIMKWRRDEVCRIAARMTCHGYTVFCPIAHSHALEEFGVPSSWDFWKRIDTDIIKRCDKLIVADTIPGWRESVGVLEEIEIAKEHGIPVYMLSEM